MSASTLMRTNQSPVLEQDGTMIYRFHHTILLAVGVCLCGTLIELNANTIPPLVAQSLPLNEQETFAAWPFFMLGSLIGGFAIVGFRKLKDTQEAARYFGVSVAGSWLLAPAIVLDTKVFGWVPEPKWHTCLAAAGVAAMAAWSILEICTMLLGSCQKAYADNGIVGLRNHIILIVSIGAIRMSTAEADAKVMTGQATVSPGQVATPAEQIARENPK